MLCTGFKREDLLIPDITITEEEKKKMKTDITVCNSRKERVRMALDDVLTEYHRTRIDERYLNTAVQIYCIAMAVNNSCLYTTVVSCLGQSSK